VVVDPDPPQPIEATDALLDVVVDAGDDRPDRAPRQLQ